MLVNFERTCCYHSIYNIKLKSYCGNYMYENIYIISTSKKNSFRGSHSRKYCNCIICNYCFKVSHHVDHTGKIFMTYITSWSHPESNLLGLIQACRDAFGELPPVFSKVSSQTQPQQHHQTLQEAHHAAPQELLQNSRQQDHRVNNK